MHDLACSIRPRANGALTPPDALGPARHERGDVFAALVADWQEVLAFDLTVNATTEESVVSRLISGPFRIDEIGFRSGSAGGTSQQLRVAVGDDSPAPGAVVGSGHGVPASLTTDSSRTVGVFYATTIFERHRLSQIYHEGTSRIAWILNNTTGAAVTVLGHVIITHLRPHHAAAVPALP